jgi:hypothetical protein
LNTNGYGIERRGLSSRPHLSHELMSKDGLYHLGLYHVLFHFLDKKDIQESKPIVDMLAKDKIKHLVELFKSYQKQDIGLLFISSHRKDVETLFIELKEKFHDILYRDTYLHETFDSQNVLIIIKDVKAHMSKINQEIYHEGMLTLVTVDKIKVYIDDEVIYEEIIESDNSLYLWAEKLGSSLRDLKIAHLIMKISKKDNNYERFLLSKLDSKLMTSIPNRFKHTNDLPVAHLKMRRYHIKPLEMVLIDVLKQKDKENYFDMTLDMYIAFHMRKE